MTMLTMKVSVKGDKALGQNPRRVVERKVFGGATVEEVSAKYNEWLNKFVCQERRRVESISRVNVVIDEDKPDGPLREVATIYHEGWVEKHANVFDISLVSVNRKEDRE